jgi:uncharacterized protein
MITNFPEFSKIFSKDQLEINKYTEKFYPYSDFTFQNLWCFNIDNRIEISCLYGNLVIKFFDYINKEPFITFIGDNESEKTLNSIFSFIGSSTGYSPNLKRIPGQNFPNLLFPYLKRNPDQDFRNRSWKYGEYTIKEDLDNSDYVYLLQDQVTYKGNKFETNRNLANFFEKSNEWRIEELDLTANQSWNEIRQLSGKWQDRKSRQGHDVFDDVQALLRLHDICHQIKLLALGLYVKGILCAYSINELTNSSYAIGLFEHGDVEYRGIYQFLRKKLASKLWDLGFCYLNHQQDLGIENLRSSKLSYKPIFHLEKFKICR